MQGTSQFILGHYFYKNLTFIFTVSFLPQTNAVSFLQINLLLLLAQKLYLNMPLDRQT